MFNAKLHHLEGEASFRDKRSLQNKVGLRILIDVRFFRSHFGSRGNPH